MNSGRTFIKFHAKVSVKTYKLFIVTAALAIAPWALFVVPRFTPAHLLQNSVPDIAAEDVRLGTLVNLLTSSGLIVTLKGHGPLTLFAPTDEAFSAMPANTFELLRKDRSALKNVLLYHIAPDKITSVEARKMTRVKMMSGENVSITREGRTLMINDAKIIDQDIKASNGIIHMIDKVLLPP
jgi:transforming growth factor-beta-induced protein